MAKRSEGQSTQGWAFKVAGATAAGTAFSLSPYTVDHAMTDAEPKAQSVGPATHARPIDEALLNARIEASEARLDLKIADRFNAIVEKLGAIDRKIDGLDGKFSPLETKIDAKPGMVKILAAAAGAVATGLALTFAVLSYAGDRFDGGMSTAGVLTQQSVEHAETLKSIDARLTEMEGRDDNSSRSDSAR